ncbi:hypothetical protein OROMI_012200 [Orobanche minor]
MPTETPLTVITTAIFVTIIMVAIIPVAFIIGGTIRILAAKMPVRVAVAVADPRSNGLVSVAEAEASIGGLRGCSSHGCSGLLLLAFIPRSIIGPGPYFLQKSSSSPVVFLDQARLLKVHLLTMLWLRLRQISRRLCTRLKLLLRIQIGIWIPGPHPI